MVDIWIYFSPNTEVICLTLPNDKRGKAKTSLPKPTVTITPSSQQQPSSDKARPLSLKTAGEPEPAGKPARIPDMFLSKKARKEREDEASKEAAKVASVEDLEEKARLELRSRIQQGREWDSQQRVDWGDSKVRVLYLLVSVPLPSSLMFSRAD